VLEVGCIVWVFLILNWMCFFLTSFCFLLTAVHLVLNGSTPHLLALSWRSRCLEPLGYKMFFCFRAFFCASINFCDVCNACWPPSSWHPKKYYSILMKYTWILQAYHNLKYHNLCSARLWTDQIPLLPIHARERWLQCNSVWSLSGTRPHMRLLSGHVIWYANTDNPITLSHY